MTRKCEVIITLRAMTCKCNFVLILTFTQHIASLLEHKRKRQFGRQPAGRETMFQFGNDPLLSVYYLFETRYDNRSLGKEVGSSQGQIDTERCNAGADYLKDSVSRVFRAFLIGVNLLQRQHIFGISNHVIWGMSRF